MYDIEKVSCGTVEALKKYQSLILKWNKVINLVSYRSENELWERHILDSLQLMKYINNLNIHIVDVGSGGGFPGVVLSIAGVKNVTLIESDVRKSAFLLQTSQFSNNKITVVNKRIENIVLDCDILTSRAFSQLDKILINTQNIRVRDKYLLLKGKEYQKEIDEAHKKWAFDYLAYESITSNNSKVLEVKRMT